jgi:hypothetical protein
MAAMLHLAGLSIPKAMLVLADLSFLALAGAIIWALRRSSLWSRLLGAGAFGLVTVPLFSSMARDGFFGQLVALGFYAAGSTVLVTGALPLSNRRLAIVLGLTAAGATCYPDAMIWMLPTLLLVAVKTMPRWALFVFATVCAGLDWVLLGKQIERVTIDGGGSIDWKISLIVLLTWVGGAIVTAVWARRIEPDGARGQLAFVSLLICWVLVAGLVFYFSIARTGHLAYYARKNLYFLAFLSPLLAAQLGRTISGSAVTVAGLGVLLFSIPVTIREPLDIAYSRMLRPVSSFDGADERCVQSVRAAASAKGCAELLILPGPQKRGQVDEWGERITRILAANSYGGRTVVESATVEGLEGHFGQSFPLAKLLMTARPGAALRQVRQATQASIDCYAVGPELVAEPIPSCDCAPETPARGCLAVVPRLSAAAPTTHNGPAYSGFLGTADCMRLSGWVWDESSPEDRVQVEIVEQGVVIATAVADVARDDLLDAAIGDGRHGFSVDTPASVRDGAVHTISVRVTGSAFTLAEGARRLTCQP